MGGAGVKRFSPAGRLLGPQHHGGGHPGRVPGWQSATR